MGLFDSTLAAMAAVRGVAVVLHDISGATYARLNVRHLVGSLAPIEAMGMVCAEALEKDHIIAAAVAHGLRSPQPTRTFIASAILTATHSLGPACGSMGAALARAR